MDEVDHRDICTMARRESDYSEEKQFYQDIFSMLCNAESVLTITKKRKKLEIYLRNYSLQIQSPKLHLTPASASPAAF